MTTQEKFGAYSQYVGGRAIVNIEGIRDNEIGTITAASLKRDGVQVAFDGQPIIGDDENWCTVVEHCKLILKPMAEITEEDALHVAKIVKNIDWKFSRREDDNFFIQFKCDYNDGKGGYWISINKYCEISYHLHLYNSGTQVEQQYPFRYTNNPVPYIEIIDYLRSKGYAVPYMGNDLFDNGLAITESEAKKIVNNTAINQ